MREKVSPWQIVFYVSLSVLSLWLILKVTGIIQTPTWLEYGVPIASLIFAIPAHHQHIIETLARVGAKVEHLDKDVEFVKADVALLKQRTAHL
jgi:hypothetical protein